MNLNVGDGFNGVVHSVAVQSDGRVVVGGQFTSFNGTPRNRIARLNTNGSLDASFDPGAGFNGVVYSVAVQSDGKVIVGGYFTSFNGTPRSMVARLNTNGSLDASFNNGAGFNNPVLSVAVQSDGKVVVGGTFTSPSSRIARFNSDGSLDFTFYASFDNLINSIAVQNDGKVVVGGSFTYCNGTPRSRIARLNTNGSLDFTFNASFDNPVYSVAIQPDNKVIVGGVFTYCNGTFRNKIARLNTNGSLDGTFIPGAGFNSAVHSVAVQSDGRVVVGGQFTSFSGTSPNRIARLNTNGSLDGTFIPGAGFNDVVYSIAVQSGGKVIVGGTFTSSGGTALGMIARLDTNGSLDFAFNPRAGFNYSVSTVAVQSDGKIIVGGGFTSFNGTSRNKIARLNADGSLDTSFDPGAGFNQEVRAVAIQPDGKVVVGGWFTSFNGTPRNRIARLNADGSLDASFDTGTGFNNLVLSAAVQSDGKVVVGGDFTVFNGAPRNRIARLNADGSLDTSFDPGTGFNFYIWSVTVQSDGKVVVGGQFTSFNGAPRNGIARLSADGSLDTAFDTGTGFNNLVLSAAVQSDGKVVVGGFFSSFNDMPRNRIARLNADGSLDTSFNPGTGFDNQVYSVVVQSDGKVVVGGQFTSFNGAPRSRIARLSADGSLDTAFNPGTGFYDVVYSVAVQSDGKVVVGGNFTSFNGTVRNRIARLHGGGLCPSAPAANAQKFCSADNKTVADLVATGTNLKWYSAQTGGAMLSSTDALSTKTYYVSQTSAAGCESERTAVNVTVNTSPTAVLTGGGTICPGASAAISITLTGTGPWSVTYLDNTTQVTVSTANSPLVIPVSPGDKTNYSLMSVSDATCTGTVSGEATVAVEDTTPPIALAQNVTLNLSEGSALTPAAVNNGSSDNCTAADALVLSLSKSTFTCADAGENTVTLTVTDAAGLSHTANATVTVVNDAAPVVAFTATPVCIGTANSFTNTSTGLLADATYAWDIDNNGTTDYSTKDISHTYTVAGIHAAKLTITQGDCSYSIMQQVEVKAQPSAPTAASNGNVVYGSTLQLQASSIEGATYTWTGPNNFSSTAQNPEISDVTMAAAGTYSVTATVNGCTSPVGSVDVSINKAAATLALVSEELSQTYSGSARTVNYTISPTGLSGVTVTYTGTNGTTYASSTTPPVNAGSYTVEATLSNDNYQASPVTGTLVIDKAIATVSFGNLSHTYDGTGKAATATTSPEGLAGVNLSYRQGATPVVSPTGAGSYTVEATLTNANYQLASSPGTATLEIDKAIATITLESLRHTYDGNTKDATYVTNPAVLTGVSMAYSQGGTAAASPTNAGSYVITATLVNDNYQLANPVIGTLVIDKANASINLGNLSHTYDGTGKAATATTGPEGLSGISLSYKQGATPVAEPIDAGSYTVLATLANPNYQLASGSDLSTATLVIGKAIATITLENLIHTYDGSVKSATATTSPANLTGISISNNGKTNADTYEVEATLDNENYQAAAVKGNLVIGKANASFVVSNTTHTYDGTAKTVSVATVPEGLTGVIVTNGEQVDADTYQVSITIDNQNYQGATSANLTINPRAITATADAGQTKVYGTDEPVLTYKVTTGSLVSAAHLTGALERAPGENVSMYAISKGSLTANANYVLTYEGADFEIKKRSVVVTADALGKVYGASNPELTYHIASGSLVEGDDFTGKLERAVGEDVDTYSVSLGTLSLGGNYSLSLTEGSLFTITPKAITVAPIAGQNKVYGSSDPVLSFTNTALVGTDAFTGALSRINGEDAGPYTITRGTLGLSSNYTLVVDETVTFQITPKALVASIATEDKVYDGTTTATATGTVPAADVVDGDDVTVTVSSAAFDTKNAGTDKTVNATVSISNPNYILGNSTASTTASITAKEITGAFEAANKVYDGTAAAIVTGRSLQGVIGQDDVQLSGGKATFSDKNATDGKTVMLAEAELIGQDKDNYKLTEVASAAADITPKPASVTPVANSKVYGTVDPALAGSTSGFVTADGITASIVRTPGESVNTYTISATLQPQEELSNYAITYNTAGFEITKARISVIADNSGRVYGDENPAFTGTVIGVVAGDEITASYATAATKASATGTYPIESTLTGDALGNYEVSATDGTLTVTARPITISADAQSKTYGETDPDMTYAITAGSLVGDDGFTGSLSRVAGENVGSYAIEQGTVALSDNYALSYTGAELDITQKQLTASIAANNKLYDGNVDADATGSVPAADVVGTDVVHVAVNSARFDDKHVGGDKEVTATVTIDHPNYKLTSLTATTTASVSQRPITVIANADSRVYNGTNSSSAAPVVPALQSGDEVATAPTQSFESKIVASGKTLTAFGLVINDGNNGGNYSVSYQTNTAGVITAKAASVTPLANTKAFGENDPPLTGSLVGFIASDGVSANYSRTPGEGVGSYVVSATLNPEVELSNYHITYNTATFTVTAANTSIAMAAISPVQYSDNVTLAANVTSATAQSEVNATAGTVKFYLGSVAAANLLATATAVNGQASSTVKIDLKPAQYNVIATYTPSSSNLGSSTSSVQSMTVKVEDAEVVYSGLEYFATANSTSLVANVEYLATVTDRNDGVDARGIITNAKARFAPQLGSVSILPVDLLNQSNTTVGVARTGVQTVTINSSELSAGGKSYEVLAYAVGDYYTGKVEDATVITVAVPGKDFVNGGGHLVVSNSAGTYAAYANSKVNFGFTMKWNKSGKNIQGQANIIFRRKVNGAVRTYQIKSNAINTLGTANVTGGRRADFNTKANLTDVTDSNNPISMGGALDLSVQAFESTVTGVKDQISITLRTSKGELMLSTNWLGGRSEMMTLNGGNIRILSTYGTSAAANLPAEEEPIATTPGKGKKLETAGELNGLSAARFDNYPNAFADRTTIRFAFDKEEQFALEVYDVRGALIKKVATGKAEAGQVYEYELDARNLAEGVYIARLITASKAQSLKMVLKK
ncbi:MBG domain-containing protein [Pontibacter roseus]|uniref:MBG domain-containing protein n=1 Tax=Pontibacter roseus TaxID=336989 RepID=UPI0014616A3D|nr:MBG domain-containing protein [Pontibacter roseus]